MRLIDADELKDFFFGETSGTEEIIRDLMDEHNLTYLNDVNEDEVMDFARDLIKGVQNVIDTQPTACDIDKAVEELERKLTEKRYYHENEDYFVGICEAIEIVKAGGIDD